MRETTAYEIILIACEWQLLGANPRDVAADTPLVYFGSFQDLLGRDRLGNIKPKNEWIHTIDWDLVVFDEYHFGAWRDSAKELFEGEDDAAAHAEIKEQYATGLDEINDELDIVGKDQDLFLPITTRAYLYLSGTPFKALATGEFIEEQIFNWTYTDEQRAKAEYAAAHPDERNPYGALPQMRLLTYQMPDELLSIASGGEFDEFDLNEFFKAKGSGILAQFEHKDEVQKWLEIIRGSGASQAMESLKMKSRPPWPYSDVRLLPYLNHAFWFLPNVAACHAMKNLLEEDQNVFWREYEVIVSAGADPTNFGVWRTGLLLSGLGRPAEDVRRIPIIHSDMPLAELENGGWRQLRILPEAPYSYAEEGKVRTNPNDFYSTISGKVLADRDWLIFSLIGHTNRDAAEFLHNALLNDPKVGKLLLAKRFKEALALRPDLPAWEWPDETITRWKKTGGKDYLPPFYFLVILSEFQRLAQNATALMALSFRTDGTPLTIASLIEDIEEADSKKTGSAFDIFESSIANLTALIPLQTYALLPEDSMISGKNSIDGMRYTANAFRAMKDFISRGTANMFAILSGYKKESQSAFVALAMSAHPDHRRDRKIKGGDLAIRTEYVAKYWGLNWLEHPYFGLFQLAQAADRINAKYRKIRRPLRVAHNQNRVINRGQAIARIARAWLETTHPAAYKKQWQKLQASRKKNSSDRQYSKGFGYENDDKKKEYSDHQYEYYDPLFDSLVDVEGKIDERLLSKMNKQAAKKPEKGLPGFTAQYHYNLWFETENDDIGFWIGRRNVAQKGKIANLPLTSLMIVSELLSDIELLREHPAAIEDIVSQNLAMTIGEFSLDPMHAFLRRRGLKLAKRFTNKRARTA